MIKITVSELVVKLLFQSDKVKVDDFVKSVKDLNVQSILSLSAFGGMAVELKNLMVWASAGALVMARFGTETGLSADEMGLWANIAKVAGINAQDAFEGVTSVQKTLLQMQFGMRSMQPFAIMQFQPSSDPFTVIKQWAAWAKRINNPAMASMMAESIGIPRSMLNMIDTLTDPAKLAKIEAMNIEWKKSVKTIEPMRKEFALLGEQYEKLGMQIAVKLAPHVQKFAQGLESITNAVVRHKFAIIGVAASLLYVFNPELLIINLLIIGVEQLIENFEKLKALFHSVNSIQGKVFSMALGLPTNFSEMSSQDMERKSSDKGYHSVYNNDNKFVFNVSGAGNPDSVVEKIRKFMEEKYREVVGQDEAPNQ